MPARMQLDQLDVISATTYGENGYPHPARARAVRAARDDLSTLLAKATIDGQSLPAFELLHASFVGGPKHIPVRYRIRPARA